MTVTEQSPTAAPATTGPLAGRLGSASADVLLAELRARERAAADPAVGGDRAERAAPARRGDDAATRALPDETEALDAVDTADIARELTFRQRSIYGPDDRRDLYQVTDQRVRNDADSVVSVWNQGDVINLGNGKSRLKTQTYGVSFGLCSSEPFVTQPEGSQGSGFLIGKDIIATAAHVVEPANLATVRFVFGFQMVNASTPRLEVNNSEIYRGVALLGRIYTVDATDWAIVRLDRPVTNHRIASIRRSGKLLDGQTLHVIGHPCGLPIKVAGNGAISDNSPSSYFSATLDSYGGNSGAPVFNSMTHEVEGILVRGQTDFASIGFCRVSLVYPTTGAAGEDCTRTTQFTSLLGPTWQAVDDNPLSTAIAAGGTSLYQLHSTGQIYKYTNTPMVGWQLIDSNPLAKAIAADGASLYQLHSTGDIYKYTNTPMTGWQRLDNNANTAAITAAGGRLHQRHRDGAIWRLTSAGWLQLDDNPSTIALADDGTSFYQLHSTGHIYKYTNRPMTGWQLIDDNPLAKAIVAAGGKLYQLHSNGQIYQYTNTPMTGWQLLDSNTKTAALAAEGSGSAHRMYQLHSTGDIYKYTNIPITGWQLLDSGSTVGAAKAIAAAGGQLYQRQSSGVIRRLVG